MTEENNVEEAIKLATKFIKQNLQNQNEIKFKVVEISETDNNGYIIHLYWTNRNRQQIDHKIIVFETKEKMLKFINDLYV